jgi:biopolymer transport protein ExbB
MPALNTTLILGGASAPVATADSVPRPRGPRASAGARPDPEPKKGFRGELDELQISKVERPPGFLRLAVASQGTDPSKVLGAGQDEEAAGWSSGYLAVIVRSVTFDGWVVIGLLAVMGFVSFYVMARKAGQLGAVEKANEAFSEAFHERKGDLVELIRSETNGATLGDPRLLSRSTLFQLYELGAEEVRRRTKKGESLSPHAIESIRASLDAGLVREGQKLNRSLVLLTIAISGGPFLGLLGTVVGVMITFAAIAAAGDVNVNAIAPGIAAALVATVAGLAVAIPNLFGYNWLLARVKNIVATQQVFADEFLTGAAEAHSHQESRAGAARQPVAVVEIAP